MGAGQFFRNMGDGIQGAAEGFDSRIKAQATTRADEARQRMIESIKDDMLRNPNQAAVQEAMQMQGYKPQMIENMSADPYNERYGPEFDEMAYAQAGNHQGPIESINRAIATNPYARYGTVGGAAVGGGLAMTAGAQKLAQVMGLLEEAQQTEVARDNELHS